MLYTNYCRLFLCRPNSRFHEKKRRFISSGPVKITVNLEPNYDFRSNM